MERVDLTPWVERARAGDEGAFERIVAATWASSVALARVLLAEEHRDAEDAVQEAYCQAWQALPGLRSPAAFRSWLRRITVREAARCRRRASAATLGASDTADSSSTPDLGERLPPQAPNQQDGDVARALARLPERQRAVLYLGEIEGLTDAEVAASLGIRRSTVRVHRQRGRRRLRELLDGGRNVTDEPAREGKRREGSFGYEG